MKKVILLMLLFIVGKNYAQENLFLQVKNQLKKEHPELQLENKLILISKWSVDDMASREMNKQISKAVAVYEGAKLKGGRRGIVGVLVNTDADKSMTVVTLDKDGVIKTISLSSGAFVDSGLTNVVYDATGKEVYKNLPSSAVYSSVQQLITR